MRPKFKHRLKAISISLGLVFILSSTAFAAEQTATTHKEDNSKTLMTDEEFGHYVDSIVTNNFLLLDDESLEQAIANIAKPLEKALGRSDFNFRYKVINDPLVVNAFSTPGGGVYITTGMLDILGSKDELAVVLAHEMSHIALRHHIKTYHCEKMANVASSVVSFTASLAGNLVSLLVPGMDTGISAIFVSYLAPIATEATINIIGQGTILSIYFGFSQGYEYDADEEGLELVRTAGYRPEGFIQLLDKIKTIEDKLVAPQYRGRKGGGNAKE